MIIDLCAYCGHAIEFSYSREQWARTDGWPDHPNPFVCSSVPLHISPNHHEPSYSVG